MSQLADIKQHQRAMSCSYFISRYFLLTMFVCTCAVSWRVERPVRQRVPTKIFTPDWTKKHRNTRPRSAWFSKRAAQSSALQRKQQNGSVIKTGDRHRMSEVTRNQLLSSLPCRQTTSQLSRQYSQTVATRLHSGPVSVHRVNTTLP